jgi:EAL domain-containing protein (putative c-di-GMP-specific phosphodiesterase class I)
MSSTPQLKAQPLPQDGSPPFASYAQLVRMLLPLVGRVCFYDASGAALWISDGLEEPELRMNIELLLARFKSDDEEDRGDCKEGGAEQPTYVFAIRDPSSVLIGALAIIFRDLPANTTYRRIETVERLLAPVLDILAHAWHVQTKPVVPTLTSAHLAHDLPQLADPIDLDVDAPLPAVLRRTLALATHRLQCAFGAYVVTSRAFTLSHRASPDESDLTMNAAIDAVCAPMLKLMQLRNEALLVNNTAPNRPRVVPYKFVVLPLRPTSNRLAAMLMLFRSKQDRDFTTADVAEITQILARVPQSALAALDPPDRSRSAASAGAQERPQPPAAPATAAPRIAQRPPPRPAPKVAVAPVVEPRANVPTLTSPAKVVVPPASSPARSATAPAGIPLFVTPDAAPTMEERIRTALRDDAFDLVAQRISPLRDERRPARYEVFVRMQEANRLRPPSSFFEAAEAGALMPELDRWVIRRLLTKLRENAAHVRAGRLEFCINIAAQSLTEDRFSEFVVAEVCRSSIPAGLLVFEVSECDALEHQYAFECLGARLRDVGCRIALDNCRAGLTTFGPLHKWPVSCVKIDGSLIRNVASSSRSESVVRAVTQLASNMGIETVAERVEDAALCGKLADIGMDYAQGFHFGQPAPLAQLFR